MAKSGSKSGGKSGGGGGGAGGLMGWVYFILRILFAVVAIIIAVFCIMAMVNGSKTMWAEIIMLIACCIGLWGAYTEHLFYCLVYMIIFIVVFFCRNPQFDSWLGILGWVSSVGYVVIMWWTGHRQYLPC